MAASPLSRFLPPVRAWFDAALGEPTRAQSLGWKPILDGKSTLILAPTGSGKTLAAFLAAIERLMVEPEPKEARARCRVLYVSPLKALAVDVEKNLRAPIAGIEQHARRMGVTVRAPTVEIRTGDTPAKDRARMAKTPPDVLITTPESLYLILTSGARDILASVDVVIVDEIHQMVPSKRGAHLFLSLERLERLRASAGRKPLQRIGLSATQRPLDEVARLLGGFDAEGVARPVTIVDAGDKKPLELRVELPDVDLGHLSEDEGLTGPEERAQRSIWPHIHARVVELVRAHRSTMIFVNSRRLAERFASALNEVAGTEIALAHHGSVAREKRADIEDRLKRGDLPALVATSSLELGIDMGAVDLVIQVEAPTSIASGLQRIGRACHAVGGVPRGVLFPKHRGDLLACAASIDRMRDGAVEETFYPKNPLDVLAQQIVAVVASEKGDLEVDALFALVRGAAPFAELPRGAFEGVLDMLSGRYPSDAFAELRPRITWDRVAGRVRAREGARSIAVTNGGTIPDRGLYGVFLADGSGGPPKRVGELDEEMVFEMREGEVFLLGSSSWRAEQITLDKVLVTPAAGEPGKMPFWHGDRPGRARGFGEAIGELARAVAKKKPGEIAHMLANVHALSKPAARNLIEYVAEQVVATGDVPSDKTIVVERYVDEIGDYRVCVLTPFGTRVHAPWSIAVRRRLEERFPGEIDVHYTDDGMVFRLPACDEPPGVDTFFPASDEVQRMVTDALADTSLFAARFRECAARALLLPRRHPQKRTPLWAQRRRAHDLLAVAAEHPSFPIVLETYRECLRDVFDLPALVDLLRRVEQRRIRVTAVDTRTPSPFASTVLFSYVANFLYDGDAPLAEKRAQALTIDHARLRELLGEAELRQLLDPEVIEEHERTLQRLVHPAKHADAVHDMLLGLGPLSQEEIAARCDPKNAARGWVAELVQARRAFEVKLGTAVRLAAAEDAARLRDAIGIVPPRGLPSAFLEPVAHAMRDLVTRYARTHGPFTMKDLAARFGVPVETVEPVVARLVRDAKLVLGAFLPRGRGAELCDAEVLQALRRKSLARLRREVEPVDAAAVGRFLPSWHGIGAQRRGTDALRAAIAQLEGAPLVASALVSEVLPARVVDFKPWQLDVLCSSGEVVWAGVEPIGSKDGRIALYLRDHEALLSPPAREAEGPLAAKVREELGRRGAMFFSDLARAVGGFPNDVLEAVWDMVWSGEVTNDTLEPLRGRFRADGKRDEERGRPGRGPIPWGAAVRTLPGSEGRWSLRSTRWDARPSDTDRSAALARALLDRYGVVTREVAHAEGIAGGFSAVYDVLKAMEDAGRVRRGYFVAGRGGAQFALAGAEERLRALRDPPDDDDPAAHEALILASTDPANPYGAVLDWPGGDAGARPQRSTGTLVVLHEGALVGWLGHAEQPLLTWLPDAEPVRTRAARALARALARRVESGRRRSMLVTTIDGTPAQRSPWSAFFEEAGFVRGARGLMKRARSDAHALPGPADTSATASDDDWGA